jgi:hypothetical protein
VARACCSNTPAISIRERARVSVAHEILSCMQCHVFAVAANEFTADVAHVRHLAA